MFITSHSTTASPRLGAAAAASLLTLLSASAARADDPEIDSLRARVERAETEQRLREREAAVKERRRELLEGPGRLAREPTRFSRRGRLVFSELAGLRASTPLAGVGGIGGVGGLGIGALGGVGVLGGDTGLSGLLTFGSTSTDYGFAGAKTQYVAFNPSIDYFVGDHLTLGVSATAGRSRVTTPIISGAVPTDGPPVWTSAGDATWTSYTLGATPRIGRPIDVGPVTLWPKLGVGYAATRSETVGVPGVTAGQSMLARTFTTELTFDALFRLGEYVTFSVGPTAYYRRTDTSPSDVRTASPDFEALGMGFRGHLGVTLP